jgi:hypothetical protein
MEIMNPQELTPIKKTAKRLLAALLLGTVSLVAWADSPANGATLFASCSGCHGSTPLASNSNKIFNGRNARSVIDAAISGNVGGMGFLSGSFPSGGTATADIAAYLGNSPSGLAFGSANVGATAATQTVTVAASLKAGNAISGMTVSTSGDFTRTGGTCGTAVAVGTTCTVIVSFTPTAAGARTGTLSISHANTVTPVAIALAGTGVAVAAPMASLSPTTLTLASTAIGNTSAAQSVTLSNTGNAALTVSALTLSNSADFVISGGSCSAGGSVAAGSSCTVSLAFHPAAGALGTRSGSLAIAHNAAGSPGSVALSGSATAALAPVASMTTSLSFGSLNVGTAGSAQTVTLSNTGNAALTLGTLSIAGSEFTVASGSTCAPGGSVPANSSCSISVGFTPAAAGSRTSSLVVTHNAAGGQSSTSLSGTGVALTPVIAVSPTTLTFSQTVSTTSADQTVTVSNTGTAAITLSTLTLGGAQAGDFQISAGSTCTPGGSVAVSSSCLIKLAFTPSATGARSGSLTLVHNAAGSPSTITLNGTGTAAPAPAISLNAASRTFASQVINTTSASQSVTVSNSGSAALTLSALTLTGTASADFTRGGSCTATSVLAAGATCTVSFTFTPAAVGSRTASLNLVSDASNGAAVLSLSGTGAAVPVPVVSLAPTSLAFGNQTDGVTSIARSVTLSNTGSGALSIASISASSGFAVSHNCGTSLAQSASCTLSVTFTPAGLGAATGSVSVASNAAGSPHSVSLGGTGVVASPVLAWSPTMTSVALGSVTVGAATSTQTVNLLNQGPGSVTLSGFTLAGVQASAFSISGGTCTVGATLTQGAACTLALDFNPAGVGSSAAILQVSSTGTNPPDLTLTGTATAPAAAAAAVVPTTLTFSAAPGTPAVAQTLTLQSTGNAVLHVSALRVVSGAFTLTPAATNGCSTSAFDLMPGQSCAVLIGWAGSASGSQTGMVEIDTSASASAIQVPVVAAQATVLGSSGSGSGTGTDTAALSVSNAGGGGCSIARGDSVLDPTLWLLTLLAGGVLWHRRAHRRSDATQ